MRSRARPRQVAHGPRRLLRAARYIPRVLGRLLSVLPRGIALFLGAFALGNVVVAALRPGHDANVLWLDLRPLVPFLQTSAFAAAGCLLAAWAIRPNAGPARRAGTVTCAALVT